MFLCVFLCGPGKNGCLVKGVICLGTKTAGMDSSKPLTPSAGEAVMENDIYATTFRSR